MKSPVIFAASLIIGVTASSFAMADRHPNADERAKIEAALTKAGFETWGEVELDDEKVWEVEDARHKDGKKYDLELDPTTFNIIKKDLD